MVAENSDDEKIYFRGNNWEDLDRLIARARFQFLQDDDYDDNQPRRCAYLAQRFTGPALDWVADAHSSDLNLFDNFDTFVARVKQTFGVEANNIQALRRQKLDDLKWGPDVPVFFAEFDSLTRQLGLVSDQARIVLVRAKLPGTILEELARQALDFTNYETMRERLNTMWALDPHRSKRTGG